MSAAPIRGLRAMAVVRWLMLVVVASVAAGTWLRFSHDDHAASAAVEADSYACPMHPQIRSKGPSSCPICGMNLEPIAAEGPASAPTPPEPGSAPEGLSSIMISNERRQLASIVTTAAEERDVARELRMPASLDVPKSAIAEARVRVPAYLEGVAPIEVGDRVKAGQMLAWAMAPDIARGVEELRAVDKGRKGGDGDPIGDRLSDAAKRKLALFGVGAKQAEALSVSSAPAGSIAIGAPIAGVVTARRAVRGGYAGPEDALFEITDYAKLWSRATLSTEDASALTTATPASLWIGGERQDARFALIEPLASPDTRTASARFVIDNAALRLRPGTVGEVVADLGVERHLLVPRDAVVETGTTTYVFVERPNGVFEPRVVKAGPLFGADRAILRGLAVGERVVSRGAFVLDSESRLHAAHTTPTSKVQP